VRLGNGGLVIGDLRFCGCRACGCLVLCSVPRMFVFLDSSSQMLRVDETESRFIPATSDTCFGVFLSRLDVHGVTESSFLEYLSV
jgi:hypothetical protein